MKNKLILLIFTVLFLNACKSVVKETSMTNRNIHSDWMFRQAGTERWMPAEVPGTVHTDLMKNNVIEDPFYRLNEHDVQWIDKEDWEYKTTFDVIPHLLEKDVVQLTFKGLDTYATVFLNGSKILEANNMFRTWVVDCKDYIQAGENELRILFESPIKIGLEKYNNLDYVIPVSNNDLSEIGNLGDKRVSVFTRKAGYHFGWDWGPRLVTSGIWRDIELSTWNKASIADLFVKQLNLSNDKAELVAKLDVQGDSTTKAKLEILVNDKKIGEKELLLANGYNPVQMKFNIENPERWWPNGLGEQHLYEITARLVANNIVLDEEKTKIGLRTIEVVRKNDKEGSTFYFEVNGHPVFMKGGNYIPQDVFIPRVTPEQYEHIINSAVETNMNMIRVWGGGIYENDIFYDLCDEKGLLVWQDFMFACAMYPGDTAFLDNVRQEAVDNVKRLRNHPSIAIWCGNNECLSAWENWGWKENVIEEQGQEVADIIWDAYVDNYHEILPGVVEAYDDNRFYWSSSPSAEMGVPENWVDGDVHYWGVWWGKEPFSNFRTQIPRFMSEYGFQSFPELSTVKKYAIEEDFDILSEVMKSHQRSTIGNETIDEYMKRHYKDPKSFEMFLYVGHLLQAEGIKVAMESHRKNMPYCMGSLFWQMDDCWPVASWSSIDYYGKWKAQQYFTRDAFNDILVSPETDGEIVKVYGVSDRLEKTNGRLDCKVIDFQGNVKWESGHNATLDANRSIIVLEEFQKTILQNADPKNALMHVQFTGEDGKVLSENILYFMPPKELQIPSPKVETTLEQTEDGITLQLSTDVLAKNIYITTPGLDVFFTDNYFDLLPGEKRTIFIEDTDASIEEIKEKLQWVTLVDSY